MRIVFCLQLFFLAIITIIDSCFLISCYFLSWFLLMSQQERDLSCILIKDLNSRFNKSILPSPKYFLSDILCTLKRCQWSTIFTSTIAWSIICGCSNKYVWYSKKNWSDIGFDDKKCRYYLDDKYLTLQNNFSFITFYSVLFKANIKSTSDFC